MNFKFNAHNIYLFAYYLSNRNDALGEYEPDWLWNKCDEITAKIVKTEFHFNIKQYLDLENQAEEQWANLNKHFPETDDYHPMYVQPNKFLIDKTGEKIDCNNKTSIIYPVRLYDSYGLGIKLIIPKKENSNYLSGKDIGLLNPDNCLMLDVNKENKYFLGQTLLITINLESIYKLKYKYNPEKLRRIADRYIDSLLPEDFRRPPFNRSGFLFGSPIFQYGIIRAPKSYNHIIVWFIFNDVAEIKIEKNYQQLLDLFFFRSKVVNAYKQIKRFEQESKNISKTIHSQIKITQNYDNKPEVLEKEENIELDLDKLQDLLILLPRFSVEYAKNLRLVKEFQNVIVENTRNYEDKIYEMRSNFLNEDFSFLDLFIYRTCYPCQERIKGTVNFFQLDINLINNAIDSIRGQVEVEQAHRERQLQNTVTSVGLGIAVAGNFASSYEAGSIAENKDGKNPEFLNLSFNIHHFLLSFCISILFGLIIWQGFSRFFSWRYKKKQLIRNKDLN
ncbi:MAG: hypothetical protein QNJ49_00660 [Mastigocoleus sp. MO_167.B18]|nr:hypothetical protein [Mastigocoleus sp. MO_188.B34]MDJ0771929.1 hypothetical protein [Mastigocoleus sp. MO_167.B18]